MLNNIKIWGVNIFAGHESSLKSLTRVGGGIPAPRPTPLFIMKDSHGKFI